jgi:O-antigen/teichoic acid export membrane protein
MAYFGSGVYALVANSLINGFLSVCLYSYYLKWFPKFQISVKKIKILFNFSYKILIANLIDEVYKNIYTLIIAKISSISTLGFYNYGRQIPNLIASTINATIASVAFPIYSKSQDDLEKIKFMVRKSIRVGNFVIFFLMCMIASTSTNLVLIVLTEKWLPCIKFLQIFSIIFAIYHIQSVNFHAISAIGKSNVYLKYETLKKIISISILLITFPFGIMAILYGQLLSSFLYIIINLIPNKKYLFYTYNEQLIDIGPFFLVAFLTFILILFLPLGNINLYLKLLIQFIFGSFVYLALSKLFKIGEYLELYKLLLSFIRQDKK